MRDEDRRTLFAAALTVGLAWFAMAYLLYTLLGVQWVLAFFVYETFSGAANSRLVEMRLRAEGRLR